MYNILQKSWQEKLVFFVCLSAIAVRLVMIAITPNNDLRMILLLECVVLALSMWYQLFILGCILDNKEQTNFCNKLVDFIAIFGSIIVVLHLFIAIFNTFYLYPTLLNMKNTKNYPSTPYPSPMSSSSTSPSSAKMLLMPPPKGTASYPMSNKQLATKSK
jgi:hypothetical protein